MCARFSTEAMELPLSSTASCEVRSVICFLCARGETPIEIHRQISTVYGPTCMSVQMVRTWVREFKEGRTEVHDIPRAGRPSDAVNENSITAVRSLLDTDRRLTIHVMQRELAEQHFMEISLGSLHSILHNELNLSKLSARWVPKNLTDDHRKARMAAALEFFTLYQEEGEALFDRIVTGDECWIHAYTPETKKQSKEWLEKGSRPPKKFKRERATEKVFATVFWDVEGVLLVEFQPPKVSQTKEHALDILWKLRRAIQNKRRGKLSQKILYLHDNARPWTAKITKAFLEDFKWQIFPHPPHSPDLAPSDFFLFMGSHEHFAGKRFATTDALQKEVLNYFENLAAEYCREGLQKIFKRYNKCLNSFGDYVEK